MASKKDYEAAAVLVKALWREVAEGGDTPRPSDILKAEAVEEAFVEFFLEDVRHSKTRPTFDTLRFRDACKPKGWVNPEAARLSSLGRAARKAEYARASVRKAVSK